MCDVSHHLRTPTTLLRPQARPAAPANGNQALPPDGAPLGGGYDMQERAEVDDAVRQRGDDPRGIHRWSSGRSCAERNNNATPRSGRIRRAAVGRPAEQGRTACGPYPPRPTDFIPDLSRAGVARTIYLRAGCHSARRSPAPRVEAGAPSDCRGTGSPVDNRPATIPSPSRSPFASGSFLGCPRKIGESASENFP